MAQRGSPGRVPTVRGAAFTQRRGNPCPGRPDLCLGFRCGGARRHGLAGDSASPARAWPNHPWTYFPNRCRPQRSTATRESLSNTSPARASSMWPERWRKNPSPGPVRNHPAAR